MKKGPVLSYPNMLIGGSLVTIISVLTWHLSRQITGSKPTTSGMALTARTVLVTGASRGLGYQFVQQLVKLPSPPKLVIAGCRDPQSASKLQVLARENPSVKVIKMDVEKDEDIDSAYQEVKDLVGKGGLNLLINNAGIYDTSDDGKLLHQTRSRLLAHFNVNVAGPVLVTRTFLPLLQLAASHGQDGGLSCSRAGVIMMSSYMGSQQITSVDGAGVSIHYKTSKSALNMAAVVLARELGGQGIFVAALHPGWVRTDMGGPEAMFSPEESVKGCLEVIGKAREDFHGKLVSFEGNVLPF